MIFPTFLVNDPTQLAIAQTVGAHGSTGSINELGGTSVASIGITLLIVFAGLGIAKILTGIAIWRFLKLKDRKTSDNRKDHSKNCDSDWNNNKNDYKDRDKEKQELNKPKQKNESKPKE